MELLVRNLQHSIFVISTPVIRIPRGTGMQEIRITISEHISRQLCRSTYDFFIFLFNHRLHKNIFAT